VIDRPKQPPKLDDEDDDEFGDAFRNEDEHPTTPLGDAAPDERPTVSPPFDVEEYAKHSDSKLRAMRTPSPEGADKSTKPPPVPDFDLAEDLPPADKGRSPQITLTDEDETEVARIRSVLIQSDRPPERPFPGRLPAEPSRRPSRPETGQEEPPPTRAYPEEYERDPFAHLSAESTGNDLGQLGGEMGDRFSLGDFTGALEIAESILANDPVDAEALRCAEESRAKLIQMYTARIGPLDRIPMVMVAREQLRWLSIDHRAGFLLSHVDGVSSLEMILDVSGMPLLDALKILAELQQQRVISFR
jgi:hypothetical protein